MTTVGEELALLLAPLVDGLSSGDAADQLLRELGVLTAPATPAELPAELLALAAAGQDAMDSVLALDDPDVSAIERTAGLVTSLTALYDAVADLTRLDASAVERLGPPYDAADLWPYLAETLPVWLVNRWLRDGHPTVYEPLVLLDVITDDGEAQRLDFARLTTVLTSFSVSVGESLADDPGVLMTPLRRAFDARGVTATAPEVLLDGQTARADETAPPPDPGRLDLRVPGGVGMPALGVAVEPVDTGAGRGLALSVEGLERLVDGVEVARGWTLQTSGGPGAAGLVVGADFAEKLDSLVDALDAAEISLTGRPQAPWALFGNAAATRLELASLTVGLDGAGLTSSPDFGLTVATEGLRFVLSAGDTDSFLATLLGAVQITADMPLAARWSPADGLAIDGSIGLEIRIPVSKTIGPITVYGLTLALTVTPGEIVALTVTMELGAQIGPISAASDGMGLAVELRSDGTGVPVGPLGVGLAFVPPKGVGLGFDFGVAAGAGYLWLDYAAGKYTGVLDAQVVAVGISAVGIVDTRPEGIDGWSLFFSLFLDFPSIPLGFGFTLDGVGGLAGINRTLDTGALESAVRSGSLDAALFPADPIGQAAETIAELESLFPPSNDRYVFGPVVKIGWGKPATLVTAQLGLVIALPDPVVLAVLGTVTCVLPTADLDVVALHLDVGGVFDFGAGTLAIDASLHDSHVLWFALTGDMALRATFGSPSCLATPSFLMALGGFHPGFDRPAGFPELRRLSLALTAEPVLDISFECYFAFTSNSVQFGSAFSLSAQVAGFGIEGGTEFDALVEFDPFLVSTRLGFHVAITAVGKDLAGVWLDASVDGPNPWYVVGVARFKLLGLEEEVRIDEQIGSPRAEPLPPGADLLGQLTAALADEGAWTATAGPSPGVVMADASGTEEISAMPDGVVTVRQGAVPLGLQLDKAGNAPVGAYDTFDLEPAGASLVSTGTVVDWFAPGYFFTLATSEQVSSPSFEELPAGLEFGGGAAQAGPTRAGTLDFEQILRDPELGEDAVDQGTVSLTGGALRAGAAVRRSTGFMVAEDDTPVELADHVWSVAHAGTGVVQATAASWSAAHASEAGRRAATVVVPAWETP